MQQCQRVVERLLLPALAIAIGALLESPLALVPDGGCRRFEGALSGNDPDAEASLLLCRSGAQLSGRLLVDGTAGRSVAGVRGELRPGNRALLSDLDPVYSEPRAGWEHCYDDVYDLGWEPLAQRLTGTYRSERCDDEGTLALRMR
ncbi:MAG: hypothetical protein ACO3JL_02915 [Myxococcota bacterium]